MESKHSKVNLQDDCTIGEIFNEKRVENHAEVHRPLLKKPFFAYEPGAQKTLNYQMPVDPKIYRFGKKHEGEVLTVQGCLKFDNMNPEIKTEIGDKRVEDFKKNTIDHLGVGKTNQ